MWGQLGDKRIVIDTNVLVSFNITRGSTRNTISKLVQYVLDNSILLLSNEAVAELEEILLRGKLRKYFSEEEARQFIISLRFLAHFIEINEKVSISRDPDDNKILELAINGKADLIITGDDDLLVLKEFRGIKILSPSQVFELG